MKEYPIKKAMQKGSIYFLSILLILTIISRNIEGALLPQVTMGKAGSGSVSRKIFLEGNIVLDPVALKQQEVSISAQMGGEITKLLVTEGSEVKKGDLLITVKKQENEEARKEKQKQLVEEKNLSIIEEGVVTLLQKYEEQLKLLNEEYKKVKASEVEQDANRLSKEQEMETLEKQIALEESLYESGAISEAERNQTKEKYSVVKQTLEDLEKTAHKEKQDKMKVLEEKISEKEQAIGELYEKKAQNENNMALYKEQTIENEEGIKAPISGRVIHMQKLTGSVVSSGDALLSIVPEGIDYVLTFNLERKQAEKMKQGDNVSYRVGQNEGTAKMIRREYDETTKEYQISCQLDQEAIEDIVASKEEKYKAEVEVNFNSASYEIVVPASAVVKENGGEYVYLIEEVESIWGKKYKAIAQQVQILEEGDRSVAVSADLTSGDKIITSRNKTIAEGSEVMIHE